MPEYSPKPFHVVASSLDLKSMRDKDKKYPKSIFSLDPKDELIIDRA